MSFETNLFGETLYRGTLTEEVARLTEKYPAALDDQALLNYFFLLERCPAIGQWPEARKNELRAACRDLDSLRRRRQELNANLKT